MDDIHSMIHDSFEIIGLILVFVFVFFDIKYPKIREILDKDPPDKELKSEHRKYLKRLRSSLFGNILPLIVINGILLYLFLPSLVRVLATYTFVLWDFDFVSTAFLIVITLITIFFVWSIYLGVQHIQSLNKSK